MQAEANEKIRDEELRRQAEEESPDVVTVLVEADVPLPQVRLGDDARRAERRLVGFDPAGGEDLAEAERAQEELRSFIAQVVGSSPRWLRSSRTFVVQADGAQLSSIASNPLTKAIHPNRSLG